MRIKMTALDTLFFRDGKPFSKSEDTWSDGIFPPYPSVIYGALRSSYFSQNIKEFRETKENHELNTEHDPTRNLKITEIALEFNNKLLYPLPADCLIEEVNKSKQGRRITTFTSKGISSFPCDLILRTDDKEYETGQNNYTNSSELGMYLKNEKATFGLSTLPFLCNEPKVGIAIDFHSRTAKDSMLYRVDMKRPAGIDFIVGFEGIELAEKGLIRLGGEGKAVSYETITDERNINLSQIEDEFVMYLSSPSVFENGWIPSFIDVVNMMGDIAPGLTVKLASAIVNRPLMIGGFDMDKNEAKPMLKAVPAGSVYFFDIIKGDPGILQDMQGKSVSDKRAKEGFGLVYFGKTRKEIEK